MTSGPAAAPARRGCRRRAGALLLLAAAALVAPQLRSGTELVRVRNALALGADVTLDALAWAPPALPDDYRIETEAPPAYFLDVVRRLELAALPDDWARALAISRHLLGSAPSLRGGDIQQGLEATHRRIVEQGDGYCGDFVRVFTAIANAAGMTVRPWAFSFDGFGGHGHIWVEVWNRDRRAWQLVDVFQNYHFTLDDGPPLSALAFRAAMAAGDPQLRLQPLHPGRPPGWAIEAKGRDYLRRGLAEWYLPWGHNVLSVDASRWVRAAGGVSRALENTAALAAGLHPPVRLLATPENAPQRAALHSLRVRLGWAAGLGLPGLLLVVWPSARRGGPGGRRAATGDAGGPDGAAAPHGPEQPLRTFGHAAASTTAAPSAWPRVCVVGPLPPPSGGMANQCEQLVRLLRADGAQVELVRTNAPYRPAIAGRVPVLRAGVRLLPYLAHLWAAASRNDVMHVLANSGWAWHLFASPALWIGRARGTPVVVNYRGGLADEFLRGAPRHVHRLLQRAALRVTPSAFLRRVFAGHGLDAEIIPNVVDLERFQAHPMLDFGDAPHIVVARNLEPIYGLTTAIEALVQVRLRYPGATMTIAGTGPQLDELRALAAARGLDEAVRFPGRVEHGDMPALYASADVALNPSTVDNMPNSVLEAYASHLPVVSTDAGGVPDIVDDGASGLLVPVGDAAAMADALVRVLSDRELARRLVDAGRRRVQAFAWPAVRLQWLNAYRLVTTKAGR